MSLSDYLAYWQLTLRDSECYPVFVEWMLATETKVSWPDYASYKQLERAMDKRLRNNMQYSRFDKTRSSTI